MSSSASSSQLSWVVPLLETYWHKLLLFVQSEGIFRMVEHLIVLIVVWKLLAALMLEKRGRTGLISTIIKSAIRLFKKLGFVQRKIDQQLSAEAKKTVGKLLDGKTVKPSYANIPDKGVEHDQILSLIDNRKSADIDPTVGRTFAYVYEQSKSHSKLTADCFNKYIHSNALNPVVFNSLRVFEVEVVKMCASLFNGNDDCVGSITSCGTESLLLAMKTYRDYRGKGEVLMCVTGHPGINKGCSYVGLDVVQVSKGKDGRMCLKDLKKKISSKTVVVVCSAPQYPHGVVDNVAEIAKICLKYGVPLHVDSAIGGFVLPFIEKLGKNRFGPWDFRVPGVTSINADIHKYGYCPKGASVLIYSSAEIRRKQFYSFATWPGGIYISPTSLGSRNGGCIVSAWGSLLGLGMEGFVNTTQRMLDTLDKVKAAVVSNPDLSLVAEPDSTIIAFNSKTVNIFNVADCLDEKGFKVEKQSDPDCIHLSIMPQHSPIVDELVKAINESVEVVKREPDRYSSGTKAMYGMMASIPDEVLVE